MPGIFGQISPEGNYKKIGSNITKSLSHEKWYKTEYFTEPCLLGAVQKQTPLKIYCSDQIICAYMGYLTPNKDQTNSEFDNISNNIDNLEFLINSYIKYGERFVNNLKGLFNMAIIDKDNKKLFLLNDRFGYFPLFYAIKGKAFSFAPEAKAIILGLSIEPEIEEASIPEFLSFKFPLGNKTFLKGIKRLKPGSIITYDLVNNQISYRRYFISWKQNQEKENNYYASSNLMKTFEKVMKRAVIRCTRGRKKIGIFLSGGIDSAMLTAFASKLKTEIITYTFGHEGPNVIRDSSREVAEALGVENRYYELNSTFLTEYAEKIIHRGEGLVRLRESHFISCLEDIREKTDTVMIGTLGEIFRDILILHFIRSYIKAKIKGISLEEFYLKYKSTALPLTKYPLVFNETFAQYAQKIVKTNFHSDYLSVIDSDDQKIWQPKKTAQEDFRLKWGIQIGFPRWLGQQQQYIEWYLDTTHPFLDYDVFDFAMRLPMWMKQGNIFINRAMKHCFPELKNIRLEDGTNFFSNPISVFFGNQKFRIQIGDIPHFLKGIRTSKKAPFYEKYDNYGNWLRTGSKDLVSNVLCDYSIILKRYFQKESINKLVNDHMTSKTDKNELILDLINLELLHRLFLSEKHGISNQLK